MCPLVRHYAPHPHLIARSPPSCPLPFPAVQHDETFNKILDGLENEYDALRALGYSGEGFLSNGTRIGHGVSHNLSPAEARALAVKKVKERDRVARILGKGGVLGGKKALGDPREVRARAAERRMRLQKGCGGHGGGKAGLSQEEELEVKRAAEDGKVITIRDSEDEGDVVGKALGKMANGRGLAGPVASTSTIPQLTIPRPTKPKDTITLSSDDDNVPPTSTKPRSSAPPKKRPLPTWAAGRAPKPATATLPSVRLAPPAPPPTWPCPACTFANPLTAIRTCQVCLEPRPGPGKLTRAPASASGGGGGGRGGLGPGLVEAGLSMGMGAVKDDSIAGRVARGEGTLDLGERGWWCDRCGRVNNHQFWTCVQCGTVKTTSERG